MQNLLLLFRGGGGFRQTGLNARESKWKMAILGKNFGFIAVQRNGEMAQRKRPPNNRH